MPHRIDVTGKLREGENTLVVALESGVFEYCDHPSKISCGGEMGDLTKRAWLRKAQHQSGWDWQARLQNVGILGDVRLEYAPDSVVTELSLVSLAADDLSSARIIVKGAAEGRAVRGTLKLRIAETGDSVEESFELPEGHAQCAVELTLDRPKLWFPRGAGEPFRYTAEIEFLGKRVTRKFGVRKVAVDQSEHPVEGTYFILEINNRRISARAATSYRRTSTTARSTRGAAASSSGLRQARTSICSASGAAASTRRRSSATRATRPGSCSGTTSFSPVPNIRAKTRRSAGPCGRRR
ncbi:MAG: hypothetical protein V8T86_10745 [Victivallis sp.]